MSLTKTTYSMIAGAPFNVLDFGAVGDGVADDTAAIQAAIDSVGSNGAVFFPVGTYKITSTLNYAGANANAITLYSDSSPGRGYTGANLLWDGAVGGTMMSFTTANNSLVKNLSFRGEGIAAVLLKLNQPSSSGVMIEGCIFNNAAGTNSAMLQIGDNNNQVSEVRITNCLFQCSSGQSTYGILTATANVKNFKIDGCIFNGMQYGISYGSSLYGSASGVMTVNYCVAAGITVSDFYVQGGGGSLTIVGHESEGGVRFITSQGVVAGPTHITCIGCQIQAFTCPPDDFLIYNTYSKFTLIGNHFENVRVPGTSLPKIWAGNTYSGTAAGSVSSFGNWYGNATQRAPIYESASNWLLDPQDAPYNAWKAHVLSQGDAGGTVAAPSKLDDVSGDLHLSNVGASSYQLSSDAVLNESGYLSRSVYKVTIPYTAWKAAATTQGLQIGTLPGSSNCRVVGVWASTTQAYAGLAGTITLSVGTTSGGTDFLLAKDVKTAATQQGLLDAELGVNIARSTAVQGGYMVWGADKKLFATLVSGTGNIGTGTATNLSAGSTTIYVITESLP